ncbi:hypothetical protein MSHOH_2528 [Methanosarcina horonobensis HB-1 = JCM 15518]|uniref:Uncharacterized protein n=1 Tax=Methanosarcina horonobensis HB-1 = JCM 15518 TaxID=1434110 RepID=A0A0E3SDS1_9EURY|nr:hypothetical protein [Methanosarcina horonobensis]AKB79011.1 hypothetical protein MSHOH_2528 [Methanosarcina horonobensis HB-1 = JCM 15518]
MTLDLWSIVLSIPIAIIANIFTPLIQQWIKSINNKKSLEKVQIEKGQIEIIENSSYEEIGIIKDRLINIGVFCVPFILFTIGVLLNIYENTIFVILFVISLSPSIQLIIHLIQRLIKLLRYKRENKKEMQGEIEKIKNTFVTICIMYLPIIILLSLDMNNGFFVLLFLLSFFVSVYLIIRYIICYVQLLTKKKLMDSF